MAGENYRSERRKYKTDEQYLNEHYKKNALYPANRESVKAFSELVDDCVQKNEIPREKARGLALDWRLGMNRKGYMR